MDMLMMGVGGGAAISGGGIGASFSVAKGSQSSGGAIPMVLVANASVSSGARTLVLTHSESSQTPNGVTDSSSNTYVETSSVTVNSTHRSKFYSSAISTALTAASSTFSLNYISTTGNKQGIAVAVDGVGSLDVFATNTGLASTLITGTTAALANANSIVFAGIFIDGNNLDPAPTFDPSWTLVETQVHGADTIYVLSKTVASAAAVGFSATLSVARDWSIQLNVFGGI